MIRGRIQSSVGMILGFSLALLGPLGCATTGNLEQLEQRLVQRIGHLQQRSAAEIHTLRTQAEQTQATLKEALKLEKEAIDLLDQQLTNLKQELKGQSQQLAVIESSLSDMTRRFVSTSQLAAALQAQAKRLAEVLAMQVQHINSVKKTVREAFLEEAEVLVKRLKAVHKAAVSLEQTLGPVEVHDVSAGVPSTQGFILHTLESKAP